MNMHYLKRYFISGHHLEAAAAPPIHHAFEDELFFTLRQQRNNWARIAVGSVIAAVLSLGCLIAILPLDETKPYVIMVDKTTGQAEKIVQVRPATLDQQDAVRQAELVSYVVDRETYDPADNPIRIPDVLTRSTDTAASTLTQLWSSNSPQYPPSVYGPDVRVRVVVKSISFNPSVRNAPDVARLRITKIREEKGQAAAERSFIVTVAYAFRPKENATLAAVWSNPLGFMVLSYRIDAETAK
ncbi:MULTISPECIES: virB8 family protein [unclassified Neorhizobium]|uniref:virB8 family protein n=1 Tax=unclassified Neorhizobium TaxID=2629175 RepID=UPI001FF32E76|nr:MULTISPECIES: type IV secretion system protein [unclassified Neorhizobium]MCJ9670397.1 type IV secretion system protein [Neorhizobium sp. SHOUNA12B]MCJ9746290.1 type IV secretion system protein [Neorhizobium sp. SHOUNA12A]